MAGGLTVEDLRKQIAEIDQVRQKVRGITVLTGCEVDILPDGALDLPDDLLYQLDVVVAAVHAKMDMTQSEMTKRVLKTLAHPAVTILAHPTGRLINDNGRAVGTLEEFWDIPPSCNKALHPGTRPICGSTNSQARQLLEIDSSKAGKNSRLR